MSAASDVLAGAELARALVSQLLDLVTVDDARALLSAEAVRRANLLADAAELARFGPEGRPR